MTTPSPTTEHELPDLIVNHVYEIQAWGSIYLHMTRRFEGWQYLATDDEAPIEHPAFQMAHFGGDVVIGPRWTLGEQWYATDLTPPPKPPTLMDLLDDISRSIKTRNHIGSWLRNFRFMYHASGIYTPGMDFGRRPTVIYSAWPYQVWRIQGHEHWSGIGQTSYAPTEYLLTRIGPSDEAGFYRATALIQVEPGRQWFGVKRALQRMADRLSKQRQNLPSPPEPTLRAP